VFSRANLHGGKAAILFGYRTAVELTHWRVLKQHPMVAGKHGFPTLTGKASWQLSGTVARIDPFFARQKPLILAVPRPSGFFLWPVKSIDFLAPGAIKATLEQIER